MNLYAYAGNNPIAFDDPFGLCEENRQRGNLTQGEAVSQCEQFARWVEKVARENADRGKFVRVLGEKLAGFPNGIATLKPKKQTDVHFGESGFRKRFVDGDGHPARHFTANLVLSFQSFGSLSRTAAVLREIPFLGWVGGCKGDACSVPDVRLGTMGAEAGEQLWNGTLDPASLGKWIRESL